MSCRLPRVAPVTCMPAPRNTQCQVGGPSVSVQVRNSSAKFGRLRAGQECPEKLRAQLLVIAKNDIVIVFVHCICVVHAHRRADAFREGSYLYIMQLFKKRAMLRRISYICLLQTHHERRVMNASYGFQPKQNLRGVHAGHKHSSKAVTFPITSPTGIPCKSSGPAAHRHHL